MSDNRIEQTNTAQSVPPFVSSNSQHQAVRTVPMWVAVLLSGTVPVIGGVALMLPPPWSAIVGLVGLGVTGVAHYFGMRVGTPKS